MGWDQAWNVSIVMQPADLVEASLAGLLMDEVVCLPALGDSAFLERIHENERALFESSRTGAVAERYKSK